MPELVLAVALRKHHVRQQDFAACVARHMPEGQGVSRQLLQRIASRDLWPKPDRRDHNALRAAITRCLGEHGVPAELVERWHEPATPEDTATPSPAAAADDFPFIEVEMLTENARRHFQLRANPFVNDVNEPGDVYLGPDQRYVREAMFQTAKFGGILAVIGESGAGKSTLRRDLVDRVARSTDPIVLIQPRTIDKRKLTADHICDAIIADLSNESPKRTLEYKARQVERILQTSARGGQTHCVVIEEAHDLSNATLKYLKRFWEIEDGFRKMISIVMVGQPELADQLDERRNPEVKELIRRCEIARLRALDHQLEEYLTLKFKRIGIALSDIVEGDALDAIRERLTRRRHGTQQVESLVYPLLIHAVLVRAMNMAPELGLARVNGDLVRRV